MTTPSTDQSAAPTYPAVLGRFIWYDLMTPDTAAAATFYTAVTGWTTSDWEMGAGMPAYTMWMNGETALGGTMTLPAAEVERGVKPHWLAYIGTPDCDASHTRATALGARSLVAPTDIPTVGRYAILTDPQGALFALFTPETAPPPVSAEMPKPGEFAWHELKAKELDSAFAFYADLFEWDKTQSMDMGPGGLYQMYGYGTMSIGGMLGLGAEATPSWLLYIAVDSLDAALDRVRANGGEVVNGPNDIPGGRVAECRDPQGGPFALAGK